MNIEYFVERRYQAELKIEDPGFFALELNNDKLMFWYIIVRTSLGQSQIYTFGPIIPDLDILPDSVTSTFTRIDFDEYKIESIVDKFINDGKKSITQAIEIPIEEALEKSRSILEYMKNFDEISRY